MLLRQVYIESERDRIEKETKKKIERLQIITWLNHPEYEEKYETIMQDYRLRIQAILPFTF